MPALPLGTSSYERGEGDLPPLPLRNMYVEQTGSEGVVLQSRPPIVDRAANMGTGPVQTLFKRDGVVSGVLFGVSGGTLYSGSTAVGAVPGGDLPSIDGNETGILVCAGGDLYSYNGTTFAQVTLPDGAAFDAIKVVEGASRFLVIRKGTGQFYFTPVLAQTVDALDFATAESQADQLLDGLFLDDFMILFGKETVEFWPNTGDSNAPFQPLQGRVFERGIRATGCATAFGSSFAWITEVNTVCVGDESNIISNQGIEERLAASTTARAFNFFIEGTEFLAIRMDEETQCYNLRTGTWSEFATVGETNWVAQCYAGGVFGSAIDGKTMAFGTGKTELGGELERLFSGGLPINGGGANINRLSLRVNAGQTPFLTGDLSDPVIEMRKSRDAGITWGDWIPASLGNQGEYRRRVEWRGLGQASQPGFLVQFRMTDQVPLRVTGAFINEPFGGR